VHLVKKSGGRSGLYVQSGELAKKTKKK
jgi:hypothetical protein